MKRALTYVAILLFGAIPLAPQAPPKVPRMSPKEVVEQIWMMATKGELLTQEGREQYSAMFLHPSKLPRYEKILVVSNDWGPPGDEEIKGNRSEVTVGYVDAGQIDSRLCYIPPKPTDGKIGRSYRLVLAPTHWTMFKTVGNTLKVDKVMTGPPAWQIKDPQQPPWTTVNTAIRYVLEMRDKSKDPVIKKNADVTLAKLLKLH